MDNQIQPRDHASRRAFLAALATVGGTAVVAPRSLFADKPAVTASATPDLLTRETADAIRRGLDYLVKMQNDDGSTGRGPMSRNVGVCSLAGLAFMSHGSMPGRGPFGAPVKQVLDFVARSGKESGFLVNDAAASHGPMYEHGFAALFLAEAYGMSPNNDLRDKVAKATKLIVDKQNAEGGWRYMPERRDADISVTICQVMALRAARNAGFFVPNETIDRNPSLGQPVPHEVSQAMLPHQPSKAAEAIAMTTMPAHAVPLTCRRGADVFDGENVLTTRLAFFGQATLNVPIEEAFPNKLRSSPAHEDDTGAPE